MKGSTRALVLSVKQPRSLTCGSGAVPQDPKPVWHPVPQCRSLLPQYPNWEQHGPKPEATQTDDPLKAPQMPSVEGEPAARTWNAWTLLVGS